MKQTNHDLIVIGAGIFGIQAVRTYLEIHPDASVVGLEADDHVGGVWSVTRYYNGFWTQISHGCLEFSDRRMPEPEQGDTRYRLFDAKYVGKYIEHYLDDHLYNGHPLRARFRCNFSVTRIEKLDSVWHVHGIDTAQEDGSEEELLAPKIIVASGTTSIPTIPDFPSGGFQGQMVHIKNYGAHAPAILSLPTKRITIVGGGKSAADLAFTTARAGHSVSWIIRKSGHGPGLLVTPRKLGPYNNPSDIMLTRWGGTLSPSHLQPYTWWMWFLHTTWMGRLLLMLIFRIFTRDSSKQAKWDSMDHAKSGYELLRPETDSFFLDAPIGFIQDPSFWPTIAQRVQVYRADIELVDERGIVLKDEQRTIIPCDVLLLGTGFKTQFSFFTAEEHRRLGLSHDLIDDEDERDWQALSNAADQDLKKRFPLLFRKYTGLPAPRKTPMRLYNTIGPIKDRSIAFAGFISVGNNFAGAEWQALWAAAWLDESPLLNLPDEQEQKRRTAYDTQWSRRRYPYSSEVSGTVYDLECTPYGDRLINELGLRSHIEGWSRWQRLTKINRQVVYAGLLTEYISKSKNIKEQQ